MVVNDCVSENHPAPGLFEEQNSKGQGEGPHSRVTAWAGSSSGMQANPLG